MVFVNWVTRLEAINEGIYCPSKEYSNLIKLPDLLRTTFHGKNIAIVWRQIQNWNSQKLFLAEKSPSQLYNSDRVSIFKVLETNLWWAACVIICLHTNTLTMESRTWKSSQNIFFTKKIQQWTKQLIRDYSKFAKITKNINSLGRLRLYLCPCLCRRPPGQLLLGIWCWQPPVLNWTPDLKKDRSYGMGEHQITLLRKTTPPPPSNI